MYKTPSGGAIINYGPTLPSINSVPDGSVFYLNAGPSPGLYVLSILPDSNLGATGFQPGLAWSASSALDSSAFVAIAGGSMTGALDVDAALSANSLSVSGTSALAALTATGTTTLSGTTISIGTTGSAVTVNGGIILGSKIPRIGPTAGGALAGDRGFVFSYDSGGIKAGWFGFDASTNKFAFVPNATFASDVVSGDAGRFDLSATPLAELSDVTISTAPSVGAVLAWNGSTWTPTAQSGGISSAFTTIQDSSGGAQISSSGATPLRMAISDSTAIAAPTVSFTDTAVKQVQFNVPAYIFRSYTAVGSSTSAEINLSKNIGGGSPNTVGQITLDTDAAEGLYYQIQSRSDSFPGNVIRIRVNAAAMASHLASNFIDTTATAQAKVGALTVGGLTSTGAVVILDATGSTGLGVGALQVAGGASVAENLYVGGTVYATGDVIASASDARLKKNVKHIPAALSKVMALNGYTFNWDTEATSAAGINRGTATEVGVIAQEVQAVLPEAVCPAPGNNDFLTVKYDRLVALLIEAIKDQQHQIDDLKSMLQR